MIHKRIFQINAILIIIFGFLITFLNKNFLLDDALIYYRYIRNFLDGNGLVYNIGERFNALTSPAYVYISILFSLITREVETTQLVINCITIISSGILISVIFYQLKKDLLAFISSIIFITTRYFYTTFGLETNMFIFFSLLCIFLYFNKRPYLLSLFSALLILTRGEGIFLVVILWSLILYQSGTRYKLKYFLIIASILLLNFGFNYFYYGDFLPHTFTAKIDQGSSGLWGVKFSFLLDSNFLYHIAFNNQAFFILFILVLLLIGLVNHWSEEFSLILLLYCLLITVFHLAFNIQSYHWYYAIHFLTLVVFIGYGVNDTISYISQKYKSALLRTCLVILIFIYPALTQVELFRLLSHEGPNQNYKIIGEWINGNTPENCKVTCLEIGHIGWFSKRYIVDLVGLINPSISDALGKHDYEKWYVMYKPEYLVVHDPVAGVELTIQKFIDSKMYVDEPRFRLKGFKILKLNSIH
jgi:hypothetical protein